MRVWIDIDNAPHVAIFRPIIGRLRERGAEVIVTARDRTFVPEMLRKAGIAHTVIGRGQPKGSPAKAAALAGRAVRLARFASGKRFDVAAGHGSRSLPPAARLARVRNLTMFDYEHISTWLFRRFCDRILIPAAVAERRNGQLGSGPWFPYPGFKEEIYLADFSPDPGIRSRLAIREEEILAVVRPPSRSAHYHDSRSEAILRAVADRLAKAPSMRAVWLRRDPDEPVPAETRAANILVPAGPVDGLSLQAAADLVISGGGTMNREAALLGTPAYSIFTGSLGAIDEELIRADRLVSIRRVEDVDRIRLVKKTSAARPACHGRLRDFVMDQIWQLGSGC